MEGPPTSPEGSSPPLEIPADILAAMLDHCLAEKPLECCGILGGLPPRVSSIHPLRNTEASPVRYNADPRDLIDAVVALRARGAEILAIYHSHPHHVAIPSQTDLRENHYGDLPRIIVSLVGAEPDVRVWRLRADSYDELTWLRLATSSSVAVEPERPKG
jgi:[CysO sulfur-carrier protein]-S-L-cysteine hydrolase